MGTQINNRAEYDAAVQRYQQLQREAGTNPDKQREAQELMTQLDSWRLKNHTSTSAPEGSAPEGSAAKGSSSVPPMSTGSVSPQQSPPNSQTSPDNPAGRAAGSNK